MVSRDGQVGVFPPELVVPGPTSPWPGLCHQRQAGFFVRPAASQHRFPRPHRTVILANVSNKEVVSRLTVHLLGPPRIEIDGEPIEVDTRKAIALLAYLAVSGEIQRRSSLAALFWPESDSKRSRSALRRTLSALNKAIGKEWIEADRSTISLVEQPGFFLDMRRFQALLAPCQAADGVEGQPDCATCLPRLQEAVDLYRGDFLEGFGLPDSPGFDEWQFFQTESWRREVATALRLLVNCLAATAQLEEAIKYARQWVALDPLHEPAHRELLRVYALSGQRASAARHYQELERLLAEELAVDPQQATRTLYDQIMAGELQPSATPAATPAEPPPPAGPSPSSLPRQLTAFVGRETELAEIDRLLADPTTRLVTILGPGGIGKTRLSLEVARIRQGKHADGVYFVPLGAVSGSGYLVPALAEALSFSFYGRTGDDQIQKTQLIDSLRDKDILLVLDNFEHLLEGAELLAQLLEQAAELRMVVTSQERLNILGECVVEIHGLTCPDPGGQDIEECSAGRLFVDRARRATTGFSLTQETRPHVARICRLVGGMPLGIELASTLVRVLSAAEIVAQLEANLDFLATTLRNVPERHRSLRAVFAYSWQLLSPQERASFARLSIFRGGFSADAAQAVAGASLPLLIALADKSLIQRNDRGRFEVPEVLRAYALEKLESELGADEQEAVARRHTHYYANFLEARTPALLGEGQTEALAAIAEEIENIRLAWRGAVAAADTNALSRTIEPLFHFYQMRGWFREGEEAFAGAVQAASRRGDTHLQGRALSCQGRLQVRQARIQDGSETLAQALSVLRSLDAPREVAAVLSIMGVIAETEGDNDTAQRYQEESLAIYRRIDDRRGIASVLLRLGNVEYMRGRYLQARDYYRNSLTLRRPLGDLRGVALCLNNLGSLVESLGEYDEARDFYQESVALKRDIGDRRGVAYSLNNLGHLHCLGGAYDEAETNLEESLALFREIGDRRGVAYALTNLGNVAYARRQYGTASSLYEESLAIAQESGFRIGAAYALNHLGNVHRAEGAYAKAREAYHDALAAAQTVASTPVVLEILAEVATLLLAEERLQDAATLLTFIRAHASARQQTRATAESLLAQLHDRLLPDQLDVATSRAEAAAIDDVWEEMLVT